MIEPPIRPPLTLTWDPRKHPNYRGFCYVWSTSRAVTTQSSFRAERVTAETYAAPRCCRLDLVHIFRITELALQHIH